MVCGCFERGYSGCWRLSLSISNSTTPPLCHLTFEQIKPWLPKAPDLANSARKSCNLCLSKSQQFCRKALGGTGSEVVQHLPLGKGGAGHSRDDLSQT